MDRFLENEAKGTKIVGAHSLEEMVAKLKRPRRVMMLVKAGKAVDDFIEKLVPLLEEGDIIIDGGNSEYQGGDPSLERADPRSASYLKGHFACRTKVSLSLGVI